MSDKTISLNLKQFGESREKVVGWMKTLLKDIPENEQNFVLMDAAIKKINFAKNFCKSFFFPNFATILQPINITICSKKPFKI